MPGGCPVARKIVIRRVGGLEKSQKSRTTRPRVIRRVGGLEKR